MEIYRITITRRKLPENDVNQELQWLADSLGFSSLRDKDRSCYRLFVEFVKNPKKSMSSDELAFRLNLTRGTVVHHLNRLRESGIVITERNRYLLREENLKLLIDDIHKEVEQSLNELKKMAEKIDKEIGLK